MKKFLAIVLSLIFMLSLTACGGRVTEGAIGEAAAELERVWQRDYENSEINTDGYFEIKNTRVITIKQNDIEEFKDVDFVVEFVLFTDYYGSAPYYSQLGKWDTVVVYKDGKMEVPTTNIFKSYSMQHYAFDYSDIIKDIKDYGSEYNCVKKLK